MKATDELIDLYTRQITDIYRDIETELIYEVARIWNDYIGVHGNLDLFIRKLDQLNILTPDTLKIISTMTGEPLNGVISRVSYLGNNSIDFKPLNEAFNKEIITINPTTVKVNQVIESHVKSMAREMNTYQTNTQLGLYRDNYRIVNKAQMNVELGIKSSHQAIFEAVEELAEKGITSFTYLRDGKEVEQGMEGVARRFIRTSAIQVANDVSDHVGEQLGVSDWYVSQHMGARTTHDDFRNHAKWQGQVYSSDELVSVCGFGDVQGFSGINCRHRKYPHIKGISSTPPPLLNMDELERVYKLEQRQRARERSIRVTKRSVEAIKTLTNTDDKQRTDHLNMLDKKLKRQQKGLREYVKQNDDVLKRDYSREKVIASK